MDGAIYFPTIRLPSSAWTNHVLLYWDRAATIAPEPFIYDPDRYDNYTRDLIQRELLQQVRPSESEESVCRRYVEIVKSLSADHLRERQEALRKGEATPIHNEKFHYSRGVGLSALYDSGLASPSPDNEWILVERRTAREFMATLAMACAHPESELSKATSGVHWYPASDTVTDLSPFYSSELSAATSLTDLLEGGQSARFESRLQRQEGRAAAEAYVISRMFPTPIEPMSPESVETFRRRHGDSLPTFRKHVQQRVNEALGREPREAIELLDGLVDECADLRAQAEAYLKEARYSDIADGVLVSLMKRLPVIGRWVDAAAEGTKGLRTVDPTKFRGEPLAYGALAQAAFGESHPRSIEVHFTGPQPVFVPRP